MGKASGAPLRVDGLSVNLGGRVVLRDVSFTLESHSTMVILGESGCGKTTLLRAIAGLHGPVEGRILLGGQKPVAPAGAGRGIVYLNQEPLLFPHLTLFENIAFGLRVRRLPEAQIGARVGSLISSLELSGMERRHPLALSGGQRQRVAFGRALAVQPTLMLLDEPFSNLDPETRATMQDLFKRIARERGITALFVTHDLKESIRLGDVFAILRDATLRTFSNLSAFCADSESGVAREIAFWRTATRFDE